MHSHFLPLVALRPLAGVLRSHIHSKHPPAPFSFQHGESPPLLALPLRRQDAQVCSMGHMARLSRAGTSCLSSIGRPMRWAQSHIWVYSSFGTTAQSTRPSLSSLNTSGWSEVLKKGRRQSVA